MTFLRHGRHLDEGPNSARPAAWATKILALKEAQVFQVFSIVMVSDFVIPITSPEYVAVTGDETCAEVKGPSGSLHILALEWVTELVVGSDFGAPSRPPRCAAKLRSLQTNGPDGPLVLTFHDGRRFLLAGPHEFLIAPDGRSVAVCEREGGLAVLLTSEIMGLAPRA